MALTITCPSCRARLNVKEDYAGKDMRCPRCSATVAVPEAGETLVEVAEAQPAEPPTDAGPTKACPSCGKRIVLSARKCRYCRTWLDDDEEDDDDRPRTYFKPCPRCGERDAERVVFTFWGSFYGPALLTHVRCRNCGNTFNGKTGRSNLLWVILFVTIPALGIVTILGGLAALIIATMPKR
jgi:predicted RNA-binding Zn-ribbon protein involved in translation (DUF1610 family)